MPNGHVDKIIITSTLNLTYPENMKFFK